ncbi:endospore germination permease [Hathewaya histolytica]|uniref:Spore germination protein n=1 Tax=Hathewaya histolytica TaxID=1498 RepID=A0A4U9RRB5_HATHI|nr:endospore germination permease [Hathewaya histolytica]VTQ94238.1 spore germination protein [Hathewaya histolytica]
MKQNFKVGSYGIFCTMIVSIMGINIFYYPRTVTTIVETEGWIVTILACLIYIFFLKLIYKTMELNEFKTFDELIMANFGKILGSIILIIFCLYNIVFSGIGIRIFVEVLNMYLLPKTPSEFMIISFIIVGIFIVRGGIEAVIKFNEIIFWIVFIPLSITLMLTLNNCDFTNVLPVLNNAPVNYAKGTLKAMYAFIGTNIAYMIIPYAKNKDKLSKVLTKSTIFVAVSYIIVTVFALSIFGSNEIKSLLWPTISTIRSINIPGAFIERWEGVVMVFWILFFFTSFINMFNFSSEILGSVMKLKDVRFSAAIIAPIYYYVALSASNIAEVYEFRQKFPYAWINIAIMLFPICIYLFCKFKSKRGKTNEK